ncbi:RHS repeat-associated core domain-containing protein [Dyella monticola]|nr:RHS repeat-associated core domain-containing protein [Dyella monticola]
MKTSQTKLCAWALALCTWVAAPAYAQTTPTIGNVDGEIGDGNGAVTLRGWACWQGYVLHRYSPQIKLYAGGEASKGGVQLGVYQVDQPSEQAIQDSCRNQNSNNRFAIGISIAVRQRYGGQPLYVYAETLDVPNGGYVLLPGSGQFTIPTAPAVTDSVYYIHTDRLGSNVIMTDANANVVAKTDYKAYGGVANNQQKNEAPGYTGQYEDPLTGLTYMQQRYYDSDLGRFISADLIAARAGDVFNFNRYAYAANSPLNFIDPTGMDYCAAYVNGVAAGIGYCGDSSDSLGQGGSRNSNAGGGSAGGPGGGGGSIPTEKPVNVTATSQGMYCLKEWQIRGIAGAVVGAGAGAVLGSESGPGAFGSAALGGLVNGGLSVADGLMNTTQWNGGALGALGAASTAGNKFELGASAFGGLFGGAVSSELSNQGYSRPVANGTGATLGASVGSVIYTWFKGGTASGMFKAGLRGGGMGLAISVTQSSLEAALRAENRSFCAN